MPSCNHCATGTPATPAFRRVLWFALWANFTMFIIEVLASHFGDSMSLQADALDFLGDAANYGISLFVAGMALTVRARASLLKAATMAVFGAWVIGAAIWRALTASAPDAATMSAVALLALGVNVVVALMLYGHRQGDSNRQSIWLCSRNDALGNIAVMLAAFGVFASNSRWPDLLVAILVASLNLAAARRVIRLARAELTIAESGLSAAVVSNAPAQPH